MSRVVLSLLILFLPSDVHGQIEMVVDREDWRLTLYVSAPLELVEPIFGASVSSDRFSFDAAEFAKGIEVWMDEAVVDLIPVSAALHPSSDPVNFEAPWDASTAVQFAGSIEPLDSREAYTVFARFERTDLNAWSPMTFFFPKNSRPNATLEVREFVRDQVHDRYLRAFNNNPVIHFSDVRPSRTKTLLTIGFGVIFLSALSYDWLRRRRQNEVEETDLDR